MTQNLWLTVYAVGAIPVLLVMLTMAWSEVRDRHVEKDHEALLLIGVVFMTLMWPITMPAIIVLGLWGLFCDAARKAGGQR